MHAADVRVGHELGPRLTADERARLVQLVEKLAELRRQQEIVLACLERCLVHSLI